MSVHAIRGIPGLGVSIPSLDVGVENLSGQHDAPAARTTYPRSAPPRTVPNRALIARRVQETVDAATSERKDNGMRRQLQIIAIDAFDPDGYLRAKGLSHNLAVAHAMDSSSQPEQLAPGLAGPSAGSRLAYLFGALR
jgi:hypothetical protein